MVSTEIMGLFHLFLILTMFMEINCGSDCQKSFQDAKLVPKYFDYGTSGDLKVVYNSNSEAKCGNKLTTISVLNSPVVTYKAKKSCKLMTIIMFEPDLPNPPHIFLHWLAVNIPAKVMKKGYKGQAGKKLAIYSPPGDKIGDNRYTICVYYQNEYIKSCKKYNMLERLSLSYPIDPRSLVKKYNLQSAAACNFFYVAAAKVQILDDQPTVQGLESKKRNLGNMDKAII